MLMMSKVSFDMHYQPRSQGKLLILLLMSLQKALVSLCGGILAIETSVLCGVLAIRGHHGPLVNCFSAFSDELSLNGP
jgi:hypothetical protein